MSLNLNTVVLGEPRGVMRALQFIFSICAFATTTGFSNYIEIVVCSQPVDKIKIDYEYPFQLDRIETAHVFCNKSQTGEVKLDLVGDFSSDSRFFVATGVLAMLYTIGIAVVYTMYDKLYRDNPLVPMADFALTALLAILWLSSSAAWSNGTAGLKSVTSQDTILSFHQCKVLDCSSVRSSSFSTLNVSLILGFLNFFLWASDLWFIYKETEWFKGANQAGTANPEV